jgi:alpha-galactosidase
MNQEAHEYVGKLCVGLGGRRDHSELGECIGPEYPFGLVMEQADDGPILIIKTAWGGQDLCVHYRPPSAGPYEPVESEKAAWAQNGRTESKLAQISKESGQNYRWMMDHVKKVLGDIKRVYPDYDAQQGYELAGFVWFQGWNDYISGHYPESLGEDRYAEYTRLLAHFIRDIRKDLNAPNMPFCIGVVGFYGNFTPGVFTARKGTKPRMEAFRKAQAAVATLPEFQGSVTAVQTVPFWDDRLMAIALKQIDYAQMKKKLTVERFRRGGPNEDGKMTRQEIAGYLEKYRKELFTAEEEALQERGGGPGGWVHYHGSAKFHAQAGKAFAEALMGAGMN